MVAATSKARLEEIQFPSPDYRASTSQERTKKLRWGGFDSEGNDYAFTQVKPRVSPVSVVGDFQVTRAAEKRQRKSRFDLRITIRKRPDGEAADSHFGDCASFEKGFVDIGHE